MWVCVKSRLLRGWSLLTIGPNEARILFDLLVSTSAAFAALLYCGHFSLGRGRWGVVATLPVGFLLANTLLGVYSRRKTASGREKALCLGASVLMVGLLGVAILSEAPGPVLWAMLCAPPTILARLLLSLPYSKHTSLVVHAVRQRGPVVIIGGAGYIGSHVTEQLLSAGESVRVLDRLMYGRGAVSDFLAKRDFELVEGDATDITRLTLAMRGASAVVHMAGLVGDPACEVDPDFTRHTNIIATRMAKDVACSLGIYRFVFASSCSVYGCSEREVCELDELNPVSLYAQTKIDSERELLYSVKDDFFVAILRFATVFGHSRRPRFDLVANLFTAQAVNDGRISVSGPTQWRPFVHVRDLARAVVAVVKARPAVVQSQIFNVGDRRLNMTILDLAHRVRARVAPLREVAVDVKEDISDRRNYCVSFDKIRQTLGFEARTSIDEGIDEMVEEFRKGSYDHYRSEIYSNLAMTKKSVECFRDPTQSQNLYAPLRDKLGWNSS